MADEAELQDVPLETPEEGNDKLKQELQELSETNSNSKASVANGQTEPEEQATSVTAATGAVNQDISVAGQTTDGVLQKLQLQKQKRQSGNKDSGSYTATTPPAPTIAERVVNHSHGDGLKQLAYLEILMADENECVSDRDTVDAVLNVLVGGKFDLEYNFLVKNFSNVKHLLKFMDHASEKLQAEIWSMLSGILRKSRRNLLAFTEANFIRYILNKINGCSSMIADLLMDMMTVLAGYSITVSELQLLFTKLKAVDNEWAQSAPKLLKVLQQMPTRHGPDEFFSFPGSKQAAIALPPMSPQKWPYQLGWSFSTWFCLDPFTGVSVDQETPFIFCFQTRTGLGYSAHFLGSVLVLTSNKGPGKGFQACLNFDFEPRKWYHICLAYVYNRWKTSLIKCYVNGKLINVLEMPWFVTSTENFDKCFIGAGADLKEENAFCGEMSTIYMFNEALAAHTVESMYQLGPAYKGQFIYENENHVQVPDRDRKNAGLLIQRLGLILGKPPRFQFKKLISLILLPSCSTNALWEGLYLKPTSDSTPTGNDTLFVHAPHAMMMSEVKAVITHSIHSTLHSLGGIQMLFPLFGQLDCAKEETVDDDRSVCTTLFDLLCDLLESSDTLQQQMMQSRGFLVISHLLEESSAKLDGNASPQHLTAHTVQCLIRMVKLFVQIPTATPLVRHISDNLLFNPSLWIHADPGVQMMLYEYLATEYIVLVPFQTSPLRRVSTIIQLIHSIKHFYWVVNPEPLSAIRPRGTVKARPSTEEVIQLRGLMLMFIDRVVTTSAEILEDELQCFLNFVSTVNEPENLYDVLHLLVLFMINLPSSMVPLFDGKNGVRVVFKLLSSDNEPIRIQALKLLGHFLSRSTSRRKEEGMEKFNLFSLLGVKLLEGENHLTMNVYNVLFEVLVERMAHQIITDAHPAFNGQELIIQNSGILKVIAKTIRQSKPCEELEDVKRLFLDDLVCLCQDNEDNRRTILQMSVWQDWLFSLAHVYPSTSTEKETSAMVMELFRMLLYHAIRLEYGGWRVWVDTLSILHTRVSLADFNQQMSKVYKEYRDKHADAAATDGQSSLMEEGEPSAAGTVSTSLASRQAETMPKFPAYRIPEFFWSHLHQSLVSDLLTSVEEEVKKWRTGDEQQLIDAVNSNENGTFVVNTVNVLSNLSDVLITAVGGLLPLLSAATTSSGDVDVLEPGYGLSIEKSVSLLQRLLNLADIMIITSSLPLYDLEHEKNMTNGTMLRQCLRIVLTMAVRNCLECRYHSGTLSPVRSQLSSRNGGDRSGDPIKSLVEGAKANLQVNGGDRSGDPIRSLVEGAKPNLEEEISSRIGLTNPISDIEHLLQDSDVTRLKAVLYRESEDMKQTQWIAMSIIYFVSVLMVSKYRDILEPTSTPDEHDDTPIFPPITATGQLQSQPQSPEPSSADRESLSRIEETRSPSPSKRSQRSVSPYKESDSEEEGTTHESTHQDVVADVHPVLVRSHSAASKHSESAEEESQPKEKSSNEAESVDKDSTEETEQPDVSDREDSAKTESQDVVQEKPEPDEPKVTDEASEVKQLTVSESETEQVEEPGTENGQSEESEKDVSEVNEPETDQSSEAAMDNSEQDQTEKVDSGDQSQSDLHKTDAEAEESTEEASASATEETTEETATESETTSPRSSEETDTDQRGSSPAKESVAKDEQKDDVDSPSKQVSAITVSVSDHGDSAPTLALDTTAQNIPKPLKLKANYQTIQTNLSGRLEKALGTSAPLLREVFLDFAPYLTKTLLGTKGQELLSGGLTAIKMGTSAISLVMLLCSQEWQISLQKHAGLAFIELVNEGRLLSHSNRDHMVKVANEAEHILNKQHAEDANKHEAFHIMCAEAALETLEEELTCDRLIMSARRRDSTVAAKLVDKVLNIVNSKHGPWSDDSTEENRFWKLDSWEDDSRRRRRLVPNPIGSTHPEAALKAAIEHGADDDAINQAREEFHAHLKLKRQRSEAEVDLEDETIGIDAELDMTGPVSLSTRCSLIAYGLAVVGTLSITKYEVFFEWDDENPNNKKIDNKVLKYIELHGRWHMQEMRAVFSRRYLLERRAVEIFLINRTSVLFAFPDFATVKKVVGFLPPVGVGVKYGLRASRNMSLASPRQLFQQSNMTKRWQMREISNFDYLVFLNTIAGRSYNDLNQYPVFPWVLSNFSYETLDLSEPSNYRDLSKPVGALNPERRKFFTERFESWEHEQISPFHYGTHYSTSAFTLNWLIRVEPFSTLFLNLQGGKFDHANRTFSSVERAWLNCQMDTSDVKEMIPELYFLPELFLNDNRFKFGTKEDGAVVDDAVLPPWAKSPEEFVRISREALESEIVSGQIHEWIDLIFGYKQQGREAVKATNVFYYLTYEGNVDLSAIKDPIMKEALEAQIKSFGQTPSQLLTEPHPMRGSQMGVTPKMFTPVAGEACMSLKFWSNSPVIYIAPDVFPQGKDPSVVTVLHNKHFAINPWNNSPTPLPAQLNPKDPAYTQSPAGSTPLPAPTHEQIIASLPLSLDPVLSLPAGQQQARRTLGDNFDERIKLTNANFTTTIDNKVLFACGFWDNSFRAFHGDSGRILQVVYGHFDVVTCICRSEVNMLHDCFIVTGSKDCTCMIWQWLGQRQRIYSEQLSSTHNPVAQATLTGHTTPITSVVISAELGIVVSSSEDGPCLIHTMNGDLLRSLSPPTSCTDPHSLLINREGYIAAVYNATVICLFSLNGRLLLSNDTETSVKCICISRDGRYLITAGDLGVVSIWRTHDLAHLYSYPRMDGGVHDIALSVDHRYLLAGMSTGCVAVLNVDFTKWHHDYQRSKESGKPAVTSTAGAATGSAKGGDTPAAAAAPDQVETPALAEEVESPAPAAGSSES